MSSWHCPGCGNKSLVRLHSLELGPDADNDEFTLQSMRCGCGFHAVAIYRESRRGASDSWDHSAWSIREEVFAELDGWLSRCKRPQDRRCECATHQRYQIKSQSLRWDPLSLVACEEQRFSVR